MQILRQLPFLESPSTVEVGDDLVAVRAYQIIVWVTLAVSEAVAKDALRLPAVLDTGHSHYFSIGEGQLRRWAGLRLEELPRLRDILVNRQRVPLHACNLWMHRNKPGTTELLPRPVRLLIPDGGSIFPDGSLQLPRLPLLGVRTLVQNNLRLTLESRKRTVSLRKEKA